MTAEYESADEAQDGGSSGLAATHGDNASSQAPTPTPPNLTQQQGTPTPGAKPASTSVTSASGLVRPASVPLFSSSVSESWESAGVAVVPVAFVRVCLEDGSGRYAVQRPVWGFDVEDVRAAAVEASSHLVAGFARDRREDGVWDPVGWRERAVAAGWVEG